jgi:hypothetical protein
MNHNRSGVRLLIAPNGFTLLASAAATSRWASRTGARWPCSTIAGRRLRVEFDSCGLCDLTINGKSPDRGPPVDSHELNAFISDCVKGVLPEGHPCNVFFEAN